MTSKVALFLSAVLAVLAVGLAQRPSYAGRRPVGYPEIETSTNNLGNRFGEESTEKLPIEALGDRDLYNRVMALPVDSRPFWATNWQALAAMRDRPQTYPQRPNGFIGLQGTQQRLPMY